MPSGLMLEKVHPVIGLAAVADAFSTTVYSDVVDMKDWNSCLFIVHWGVGATGTTTLTVNACDDIVPTTESAVPFWYKRISSGDVEGTLTLAATTGFLTTAGSAQIYLVEIKKEQLAASGYRYCRLKCVEGTDSPILGGIIVLQGNPVYPQAQHTTTID